ncbi:MAG TPA: magnesium transporter [Gemmataceae bacterium]|nr:magnesium transporter [Gemmataceae bacterium]
MVALGRLLSPTIQELIREKHWDALRDYLVTLDPADIADILIQVPDQDDAAIFRLLPRTLAGRVFAYLPPDHQEGLLRTLTHEQTRAVLAGMSPDDQARLLEELPAEVTRRILETLSPDELKAARDLLGYPPESAGRYMTPRYVSLRPDMTARDALDHIRRTGRDQETLAVLYVVDANGRLVKELRLGTLVLADPAARVIDIPDRPVVSIPATADREEAVQLFRKYDRAALPVTDGDGHLLGIITSDDILDVAEREATEDIQRAGGLEALDGPYLEVGFFQMMKKRGGWLSILFLGEMLTTTAMTHFQDEIEKAVVLAMFVPLIISSGGNSGSQASTLVVRALALTELRLGDWWRVLGHELRSGLALGSWLGLIGFLRVTAWHYAGLYDYGEHHFLVGLTVWLALIGVVTFGSVSGSMLPFLLRRIGFDPATSSAPFVATLVDVTGLVIYFTVAALILTGTVL